MAATVDLILFLVFPDTAYHTSIAIALAKLYSNSMLMILNSRIRIIGGRKTPPRTSISCIELGTAGGAGNPIHFAPPTNTSSLVTGVPIQEEVWVDRDNVLGKEQVISDSWNSLHRMKCA